MGNPAENCYDSGSMEQDYGQEKRILGLGLIKRMPLKVLRIFGNLLANSRSTCLLVAVGPIHVEWGEQSV